MEEQNQNFLKFMEVIPTQGYVSLALGSIAISALLRLTGKKDSAVFVGQWAPTFLLMGLTYKLLQPSHEHAASQMGNAFDEAERMVHQARAGSKS